MTKKYRKICKRFVREYYGKRKRQLENGFLAQLPPGGSRVVFETPLETPLGHQVVKIARAAAGELPADGLTKGLVAEGIQGLLEDLFAPPGLVYAYTIPSEFWNGTEFGRMVRDARLWARGDELITQTEAAEMTGLSVRAVGQRLQKGELTLYIDSDEVNPRKNRRVSRLEVERLAAEIQARRNRPSPSPDELVEEYNADLAATYESLAEKYGLSARTIGQRLAESSLERRKR